MSWERPWKGLDWLVLEQAGVIVERDLAHVPYKLRDGQVHRWHVFTRTTNRTWWTPGTGLSMLGLETLPTSEVAAKSALLICEGESDTFACRQAFAGVIQDGHEPISYCVLGIPGSRSWKQEWRRPLLWFPDIYLLGDGDSSGRELNGRIKQDIPWARPVTFKDGDDARTVLQRDGARSLDSYLDRADSDAILTNQFMKATNLEELESHQRKATTDVT